MNVQNTVAKIKKIDEIYANSPSAQLLVNQAPQVLSLFREIRADQDRVRMEIEKIRVERDFDLKKFRDVAPTYTKEISETGRQIRELQATVRTMAARIGSDPNAQIVIDYTNKQISDSIMLFNNLSLVLLKMF